MKHAGADCRFDARTRARLPVTLGDDLLEVKADLVDLSYSGVGVKKRRNLKLEVGQFVYLTIESDQDYKVRAKVIHIGDKHIGLQLLGSRLSFTEFDNILRAASLLQLIRSRVMRATSTVVRRCWVMVTNTLLRQPLSLFVRPQFLVVTCEEHSLVNEAVHLPSHRQMFGCWGALSRTLLPSALFGGFVWIRGYRGLLLGLRGDKACLLKEGEVPRDESKQLRAYLKSAQRFAKRVPYIAVNDALVHRMCAAGVSMPVNGLDGRYGARYLIASAIKSVRGVLPFRREQSLVILGGHSRLSDAVAEDMAGIFVRIVIFGSRPSTALRAEERVMMDNGAVILHSANPKHLSGHTLFVALEADACKPDWVQKMDAGALMIYHAYPALSHTLRSALSDMGIRVKRPVVFQDRLSSWPAFPEWHSRDIPASVVEATVFLEKPDYKSAFRGQGSIKEFSDVAFNQGYSVHLLDLA